MSIFSSSSVIVAVGLFAAFGFSTPAAAQNNACPTNATGMSAPMQCVCPAGQPAGSIWGTGVYTSDSNICAAAVHSGMITTAGGQVTVVPGGRQDSYAGTTQNGVTSSSYGAWDSSFTLSRQAVQIPACGQLPSGLESYECQCGPGPYTGSVWGSDPYTSDSTICQAAMHTGVITEAGGLVRVLSTAGLPQYRGSVWNGVTTSDYGAYSSSITFDRN